MKSKEWPTASQLSTFNFQLIMTLCYYVTGHGYGHAVRASQVIKALPADLPVIVRTVAPEGIFREEIGRDFRYMPAEFDCGCLQNDSVSVLKRETLDRYQEIDDRNHRALASEVEFLRREGVTCVVSDVPPFPLLVAQEAGIPSLAISNFSWYEIYRDYIKTKTDEEMVDGIRREYRCATLALITPLETPAVLELFPRIERIPLIVREGRRNRQRIDEFLGVRSTPHYGLLYFGTWGLDLDWPATLSLGDWTFFTYEDPPVAVANVVTVQRTEWPHPEMAGSVDVVVSKPGYGTVSEGIANGVPLVYLPRADFAECPALIAGMEPWGGGIPLTQDAFATGDWGDALASALNAKLDHAVYQTDGARVAADAIMRFAA
jgi:hypothetical protein